MSDDAYLKGAMLLLDIEKRFAAYEAEFPDRAELLVETARVQLETIRPYDRPATPASGATSIVSHLAAMGFIDDGTSTFAMVYIGAIMRAERADASS